MERERSQGGLFIPAVPDSRFGAGLLPRPPNYCTTRVVIVTSAGEMRRTLLPFAVTNSLSQNRGEWGTTGGWCASFYTVLQEAGNLNIYLINSTRVIKKPPRMGAGV